MISKECFENQILELLTPLHGVARRLTGNDADAEDLVAETVTAAWKSRASLSNNAAFKAWVFRILNNRFISDCRKAGVRPVSEPLLDENNDEAFSIFEQVHQPFLLWFSNPEQEFADKLLRGDIAAALDQLPEHHRTVVVLADVQEYSYTDIAAILEIPVGTVRSRLARARSALQQLLWQHADNYGIGTAGNAEQACAPTRQPSDRGCTPRTRGDNEQLQ